MKVTLKANDKRVYISKELMKEMKLKRGNMVMIFRENEYHRHGFFPIDGKAKTDIDGARILWSKSRGYFIKPTFPPAEYLQAIYRVKDRLDIEVVKQKLKEAEVFVWESHQQS